MLLLSLVVPVAANFDSKLGKLLLISSSATIDQPIYLSIKRQNFASTPQKWCVYSSEYVVHGFLRFVGMYQSIFNTNIRVPVRCRMKQVPLCVGDLQLLKRTREWEVNIQVLILPLAERNIELVPMCPCYEKKDDPDVESRTSQPRRLDSDTAQIRTCL